jgi:hypothetical protein
MTILNAVKKYFSFGELKTICFDLGIDWEDFGSSKADLVDGLIRHYRQTNQRDILIRSLQKERSFLNWYSFTW